VFFAVILSALLAQAQDNGKKFRFYPERRSPGCHGWPNKSSFYFQVLIFINCVIMILGRTQALILATATKLHPMWHWDSLLAMLSDKAITFFLKNIR
jgi:hypothetical protein